MSLALFLAEGADGVYTAGAGAPVGRGGGEEEAEAAGETNLGSVAKASEPNPPQCIAGTSSEIGRRCRERGPA